MGHQVTFITSGYLKHFFFFFPKEEFINSHVYLSGFAEAVFHSTTWPGDLSLLSREE